MVYVDAEKLYAEVREDVESLLEDAFDTLFKRSTPLSLTKPLKTSSASGNLIAFNTTSFARRDVVKIPLSGAGAQLKSKVVQTSKDGSIGYALMDCAAGGSLAVPTGLYADCMPPVGMSGPFSCLIYNSILMPFTAFSTGPDNFILKNSSVQLTVSEGRITSLLDVQLEWVFVSNLLVHIFDVCHS